MQASKTPMTGFNIISTMDSAHNDSVRVHADIQKVREKMDAQRVPMGFKPGELKLRAVGEREYLTQKRNHETLQKCIKQSVVEIDRIIHGNPEADLSAFGQRSAEALHTFLMLGTKDSHEIAPYAFEAALKARGLRISDLDIAGAAYGLRNGQSFLITRSPNEARQAVKDLEAQGIPAKRWNKGAYILVYRSKD